MPRGMTRRPPLAMVQVSRVLVICMITALLDVGLAGDRHQQHRLKWLPHCHETVGHLPLHARLQLRRSWQQYIAANISDMQSDSEQHEVTMRQQVEHQQHEGNVPASATLSDVGECMDGVLDANLYPSRPIISFIVQYFKRAHIISKIVPPLRRVTTELGIRAELVVNVDNPHEAKLWADLSHSSDGFVVPVLSANVHEIRAYNRAAAVARGDFIVFIQDDQIMPDDGKWVVDLLAGFNKYPQLGAIGLNSYRFCMEKNSNTYQGDFYFRDTDLNINLAFVQVVDFGPFALRASAFASVGGLDEGLSDPGECGIFSDWELSFRLWEDGWYVAHMGMHGIRGDEEAPGGTHLPATGVRCWGRQMASAAYIFTERHKGIFQDLCETVAQLNRKHLQYDAARPCPLLDGLCLPDVSLH
eukprot:365810-Chlamydomonas_euryale.AAC.15